MHLASCPKASSIKKKKKCVDMRSQGIYISVRLIPVLIHMCVCIFVCLLIYFAYLYKIILMFTYIRVYV